MLVTDQPIGTLGSFVTSLTASHPWQLNRYPFSALRVFCKTWVKVTWFDLFLFFYSVFLFVWKRCIQTFYPLLPFLTSELISRWKSLQRFDVQFSAIRNSFLICKKYFIAINIYASFANMDWLVTLPSGNFVSFAGWAQYNFIFTDFQWGTDYTSLISPPSKMYIQSLLAFS